MQTNFTVLFKVTSHSMMYSETSQTWHQKTLTGYEGTLTPKVQIDRQNYDSIAHADESQSKLRQVEYLPRNKMYLDYTEK